MERVITLEKLTALRQTWRQAGQTIVFTNGCFDVLHRGHVEYLEQAKALGDILIVGLNSDASVRRLKGDTRPIVPQADRGLILAALRAVDFVVPFDEDTPERLIRELQPDVLVKGADYQVHEIVGHEVVLQSGGKVMRIPLTPGRATTDIIATILARCSDSSTRPGAK